MCGTGEKQENGGVTSSPEPWRSRQTGLGNTVSWLHREALLFLKVRQSSSLFNN